MNLYYGYLINFYYIIWLLCAYILYRIVSAEILVLRIQYHRCENKRSFVMRRVVRIIAVLAAVGFVAFASFYYSELASSMRERAKTEYSLTGAPNKILCMAVTANQFNGSLLKQTMYAPEFYAQCIERTPSAPNRDFCGFVESEREFTARCKQLGIQGWHCTLLHWRGKEQC